MKRLILLIAALSCMSVLQAQKDTTRVKPKEIKVLKVEEDSTATKVKILNNNVVTVEDNNEGTKVKVGNNGGIQVTTNDDGDTVRVRVGNRTFDVVDSKHGTQITTSREPRENRKHYGKFNGHWAGIEMGINTFHSSDYSPYNGTVYEGNEFFDLNYGKSLTVNLNFAEFAFSNTRKTVGFITGLGLSFMDFRFDQPISVRKEPFTGLLVPYTLESGVKKSKLNVSYLTAPLMLEIKTPFQLNNRHMSLAAGVIGGVNIGSHTKVKYHGSKDKERGNFNLNPLKYELTGRVGFGGFCFFANYSMTPLFRDGKGPELYPLVVGISFSGARL